MNIPEVLKFVAGASVPGAADKFKAGVPPTNLILTRRPPAGKFGEYSLTFFTFPYFNSPGDSKQIKKIITP